MISARAVIQSLRKLWVGTLLALVLGGTAFGATGDRGNSGDAKLDMLNQGYSELYGSVSGLANADKIFLVKYENDATQKVVTDTSDYLGTLTGQLERLGEDYPNIRLDLMPMPAILRKTQAASTKARIKSFAPVVGRTGPNFERTLLLTLSGALNQQRHLARVLAQAERSTQRRSFLTGAEHRMDDLYNQIETVLEKHYYK